MSCSAFAPRARIVAAPAAEEAAAAAAQLTTTARLTATTTSCCSCFLLCALRKSLLNVDKSTGGSADALAPRYGTNVLSNQDWSPLSTDSSFSVSRILTACVGTDGEVSGNPLDRPSTDSSRGFLRCATMRIDCGSLRHTHFAATCFPCTMDTSANVLSAEKRRTVAGSHPCLVFEKTLTLSPAW